MVRNRDLNNSWILGDSGGFPIGKGVWEGDWKDPIVKAHKKRDGVLKWMDEYMDYGMILDIPFGRLKFSCRTKSNRNNKLSRSG